MTRCSRCKKRKSDLDFYKDKRNLNGLKSQCKSCHTEGYLRTRDKSNHRLENRLFMRKDRLKNIENYRSREKMASKNRPMEWEFYLIRIYKRPKGIRITFCEIQNFNTGRNEWLFSLDLGSNYDKLTKKNILTD